MNEVKEMVYLPIRSYPPDILAQDIYNGYNYYVLSMGTHPCAYVEIPKEHKLFNQDEDGFKSVIDCHGGVNYTDSTLYGVDHEGKFIGWDYGHYGDYLGYAVLFNFDFGEDTDTKYATPTLINDCKDAIDQLIRLDKDNENENENEND